MHKLESISSYSPAAMRARYGFAAMAAIEGFAAIEAIDIDGFDVIIDAIDTAVEYEVGGSDMDIGGADVVVATEEARILRNLNFPLLLEFRERERYGPTPAAPRELRRAPNGLVVLLSSLLLSSLTTGLTGMAGLARAASAAADDDELGGTGVCHGLDLLRAKSCRLERLAKVLFKAVKGLDCHLYGTCFCDNSRVGSILVS